MKKKSFALFLAIIMLASMSLNVFAGNVENVVHGHEENVCPAAETRRTGQCLYCNDMTEMTCTADNRFLYSANHRVLWDLIETDCLVTYYASGSIEMCHTCGNEAYRYDGDHYCYEIHQCSTGFKRTCPMQRSLDEYMKRGL